MLRKGIAIAILSLIVSSTDVPNMKKLADSSQREGWAFLAYASFCNRTYYVHSGKIDVIYPKTDVIKELGLHWCSDVLHQAQPAPSSDGNYVAYVRRLSASNKDEAISIYNLADNTIQDLVRVDMSVYELGWSPNGKEIAFIAAYNNDRYSIFSLHVVSLDSHQVTALTPLVKLSPSTPICWSPDSKEVLVQEQMGSSARRGAAIGIVIVNRETKTRRRIEYGKHPSWSRNGELIAFLDEDGRTCYVINPDGTSRQVLFSYKESMLLPSGYELIGPLVWSPDMRYLIYHRTDGRIGDQRRIYMFDLKSKKSEEIFSGGRLEIMSWASARK
ncbi:MAG: hypothetical protein AABN33_16640 [Acidobacteriota bacterium]